MCSPAYIQGRSQRGVAPLWSLEFLHIYGLAGNYIALLRPSSKLPCPRLPPGKPWLRHCLYFNISLTKGQLNVSTQGDI